MTDSIYEPKIIAFLCNWCSYRASDMAGTARMKYKANVRTIRVMCSGRVDPVFVMKAFSLGADGVMIAGCHPGECHYIEQNYKTIRRYELLRHTLLAFGIEDERLRLQWASAAEGALLAESINTMIEDVRNLGPLNWSQHWDGDTFDEALFEKIANEHAEALEVSV